MEYQSVYLKMLKLAYKQTNKQTNKQIYHNIENMGKENSDTILNTLIELNEYMKTKGICGEISYRGEVSHLLRTANNQVTLNVSEYASKFFISLQKDKRFANGSISTTPLNLNKIKGLINDLNSSIELMPQIPFATPMQPICQHDPCTHNYDAEMENIDSAIMRDLYERSIKCFSSKGSSISGSFSAGMYEYGLINTLVDKPLFYRGTDFNNDVILQIAKGKREKRELRSDSCGAKISHYNPDELLKELDVIYKMKTATEQKRIEPGKYEIVFGINAIAELIRFLTWLCFDGEAYEYEMGMLQKSKHKIGAKILGDNFTLLDDPDDPNILYTHPFGLNGTARNKIKVFEKGVLGYFYYSDKLSADRFGMKMNNDIRCANLKLEAGTGPFSFDEMIKSCDKPTIYIPYLHYMNSPNSSIGEITATTRFGTFLIENGRVLNHLVNCRLNDTLFNIFNNIKWFSKRVGHVNLSDTYDERLARSLTCPYYMKVDGVSIS